MAEIVFVCTGNICRSPMAETLLRNKIALAGLQDRLTVRSAGLAAPTGSPASEGAKKAMAKRGLTIDAHRATQMTLGLVDQADLVLTMTERHRLSILQAAPEAANKTWGLKEYAGLLGDVEDPYGGSDAVYESCAAELEELLDAVWEKVSRLAGK
ncbi:low molecular weight protein arginine phosphatase [Azotosporobacter soli]|uniref:low molecular weight protein arginine phosphatase n=1 Tax=Azotosporobacter soli TaxID=3055040 RepID=UPI0031FEE8EA